MCNIESFKWHISLFKCDFRFKLIQIPKIFEWFWWNMFATKRLKELQQWTQLTWTWFMLIPLQKSMGLSQLCQVSSWYHLVHIASVFYKWMLTWKSILDIISFSVEWNLRVYKKEWIQHIFWQILTKFCKFQVNLLKQKGSRLN